MPNSNLKKPVKLPKTPTIAGVAKRGGWGTPVGTRTATTGTSTDIVPTTRYTAAGYKDQGPAVTDYSLAATGGGGTGGGTPGGETMPGGYVPALYNEAFWYDRDALAQDILGQMGIDNPQLTELLGPTAGAVNYLQSFLGGDQPGEFLGAGGQAGQVTDLMNQLLTPGGEALDPGAIMAAIANADPNSLMGQLMSKMSPKEVGDMAMYLVSAAGGNPLQQQGMQAMFDQSGRNYNIALARGGELASRPYWQGLQGGEFGRYFGR